MENCWLINQAGYSIPDYFELTQQNDGQAVAWETLAYALSQFKLSKIPSFMLKPLIIEELIQYRETTIEWLLRQAAPPTT